MTLFFLPRWMLGIARKERGSHLGWKGAGALAENSTGSETLRHFPVPAQDIPSSAVYETVITDRST